MGNSAGSVSALQMVWMRKVARVAIDPLRATGLSLEFTPEIKKIRIKALFV